MASIDIRELEKNKRVAKKLLKRLRKSPCADEVHGLFSFIKNPACPT